MAEENVLYRSERPETEISANDKVYGNIREIDGKGHFKAENKIVENATELEFDGPKRYKVDVIPVKKKKKRKKLRERRNNNDFQGQEEGEAETVMNRREKRRSEYKRKKKEATDVDGTCTRSKNKESGLLREHQLTQENLQNIQSDGLWFGENFIHKKNIHNKNIHKKNIHKKNIHKKNNVDEKLLATIEPSTGHFSNNSLFLASSFQSESRQNNRSQPTTETNNNCNSNINSDPTNSNFNILPDGNNGYIKRRKKKRNFKKRLANLKKTSSKISILPTNLESAYPRLELGPARSERPVKTSENRDRTTEEGDENGCSAQYLEPLKLCSLVTKFPLLCFFCVTFIHVAIIAITTGLVITGNDVFPAVFDDLPLYIYNDVRLKELSWRSRTSFDGYVFRPVYDISINLGYRGRIGDTVEVIYEKPGENILTPAYLYWIKSAEERLFSEVNFQTYFCLLDHNDDCVKPQSLIRLFDGTYSHIDTIFYDRNFNNISAVLYKASIYNETKDYLKLFLGKDSVITPTRSYTTITRSFFFMGWPLYRTPNGNWGTFEDIKNYLADTFKPKIENIRDFYLVERLNVYYLSKMLYEHDLVQQALTDIKLAIGSVLFIFLFMCFQTGTVVVTSLGVLSILSSFLLTNLVYRYVFQFKYFGFFHVIAIFLILGIGADDLFVFYDTWRLTGHTKYPSDAHRLSDCFRKAAKTTFVTSLTTMMAFLVSGLSPLLPVKTFGIFTGVLVAINYIWVIIYFPSIIIIHHKITKNWWRKFHRFLLSICLAEKLPNFRKNTKPPANSDTNSISETNSSRELLAGCSNDRDNLKESPRNNALLNSHVIPSISRDTSASHVFKPATDKVIDSGLDEYHDVAVMIEQDERPDSVEMKTKLSLERIQSDTATKEFLKRKSSKRKKNFEDRNRVVKFLRNTFFDFMTKRIVKILIPLIFLGVSIFFIHRATLIEPDTHQLRLFRSNHNYAKATQRHYFSFLRNQDEEYQRLYLVWGILPADISACDQKSAAFCFGKPQYDYNFDMNTDTAQTAFKDLCQRLENLDASVVEKLHIQRDSIDNQPKISCFTEDFERYFKNKVASSWRLPSDMNLSLPVKPDQVTRLMESYRYIYRYPLPAIFSNYFEVLVSYWLTDGYELNPTKDYFKYNELFAERKVSGVTADAYYTDSGLYYGTMLQYLAIEINTTLNLYSLGYEEGLPIFQEWENFIHSINDRMPVPLKNGIQVTETLWHWLHVQETLASSAVTGIIVGLLSAWPILVLTTLNFIIGTIAAITIGLVTACVVGLIPLAGWKLGVLESINLCMVVGLSVDYIVHLAEAYRMSKSSRRLDRVHDMLESIGLSVISGAITTMGAAMFMLFAKIQFFFQFGIFILSTVGISLLFSLLGFTTMLSLCGPQGNTGSLSSLASGLIKFCKKRDDSQEKLLDKDAETKPRLKCPCASPSVLVDRFYDWLSYGNQDSRSSNLTDKSRSS